MSFPAWHHDAWAMLRARRDNGSMPHALLLAGPAGLGKRVFAERLVRALLCDAPVDGDACGRCRACLLLDAGTHPDRVTVGFEINANTKKLRTTIVVEQMRQLSARLAMASQMGGWQVATIDPADAMTTSAANALLKTLEEPTPSSLMMLVADAPWRLPQTIRSRCQRVDFRLPTREVALDWLHEAGVDGAEDALDAADGNPGLARQWFEQGLLEERRQVAHDLAALARGQADAYTVGKRWLDENLAQRLWFAAGLAAAEMRLRASGQAGALVSQLSDDALAQWFERANRAREDLRTTLRSELVVLDLLSRWR
ncbi:MAG TPA: DNA polymerase III subunit delta' [Rhodanobacteraceae bacterium]